MWPTRHVTRLVTVYVNGVLESTAFSIPASSNVLVSYATGLSCFEAAVEPDLASIARLSHIVHMSLPFLYNTADHMWIPQSFSSISELPPDP